MLERNTQVFKILVILSAISIFAGCNFSDRENADTTFHSTFSNYDDYRLVDRLQWDSSDKCVLTASLFDARTPLADLFDGQPKYKFEIKNESLNKVILSESGPVTALSLESKILDADSKAVFVSLSGGSADNLKVIAVSCDSAKEVFNHSYKDLYLSSSFYANDEHKFVISVADNLTEFDNKLMVLTWEWDGTQFLPLKEIEYNQFIENLHGKMEKK